MKFVRYEIHSKVSQGVLETDTIQEIEGNMFEEWTYTGVSYALQEVKLLAPLKPNQIIGIGANYVSKIEERPTSLPDLPVFFYKSTSSVIGPEEQVVIPGNGQQVRFESELAVVIGKEAKNIQESEVLDYIFGYTIGNDVTAPQYFHEHGHWMIGKSFDTFTPLGPSIETALNVDAVRVEARLNGIEKQNSGMELMVIPVRNMIAYLSTVMTLKPGDVILTGSPMGSELIGAGNAVECDIKGIGILKNTFIDQH